MKKSTARKLSLILSVSLLSGTVGAALTDTFGKSVTAFAATLQAGSTYAVTVAIPGYMDSANASKMINSVTSYPAGNYYIYKIYNGMLNITKIQGNPGIWINPSQNGTATVPVTAQTAPATSTTTAVTTANLNMRAGAGTSYSIIKTIPSNTTVQVLESSGTWKKVSYGGITGWCSATYLKVSTIQPAPVPTAPVSAIGTMKTTGNLYMRSGPGTTYSMLKIIPSGTIVQLLDGSGEWKKIVYGGITGWSSGKFLVMVTAPAPPVVVEPVPVEPPVVPEPIVIAPVPVPVPAPVKVQKRVTASLNLRTGVGTTNPILVVLPKGAVVDVIKTSGDWNQVTYGQYTGWCSGNYLTTDLTVVYKVINVPYFSQLAPVYAPVGCEPTSLIMALKYKGIATNTSYTQFLDAMPKSATNPAYGFVGSPYEKNTSLRTTIYPQPLTDYGNTYAAGRTFNISGSLVIDIKKEIIAGNPVVVYLTAQLAAPIYATYVVDGVTQSLLKNNHAVLVTGYDSENNKLRITDPWSYNGRLEYWVTVPAFASSYNIRNHAVVVR